MPHTPNQTLRSSVIWRFKERFQFSGWLQYVFNAIAALVFLLIAGVGALIGAMPGLLFWPPLVIGGVLVLVLAFDVCTLKLGLRPPERVGPRRGDLDAFDLMRAEFPQYTPEQLRTWVVRFFRLWCRNQWKRERYAPSFHVDDKNLDPKTWCRFPILSGGYELELRELLARTL